MVTASCGCDDSTCGSTETAHLVLEATVEELSSATLVACRGDQCWSAELGALSDVSTSDRFIIPAETDSPSYEVRLAVWVQVESSSVSIDLNWDLSSGDAVQSGDVLSASITTAQNEELFAAMAEVKRFTTTSNACGTTECRNVEVNLVPP